MHKMVANATEHFQGKPDSKLRLYVIVAETKLARLLYDQIEQNQDQINQIGIGQMVRKHVP